MQTKVKSFKDMAAVLRAEQNRKDVQAAADLRKTAHLAKRGTGKGPRVAKRSVQS